MKFFGEPNLYIKIANKVLSRGTGLKGFSFDGNGEYETENEHLIKALKLQFKCKESVETVEENEEEVEKPKRRVKRNGSDLQST